jgi:hypothetical protein
MSLFDSIGIACPACGRTAEITAVKSINADRTPELRTAVLEDSLQRLTCAGCGAPLRLEPQLLYLSLHDALWIIARPIADLPSWPAASHDARALFERNFAAAAPGSAGEIGRGLTPRLVFGWPALREKLVCRDAGLDDAAVELAKSLLLLSGPLMPAADGTELRLTEAGKDELRFAWIEQRTGLIREFLTMPPSLLHELDADPAFQDTARKLRGWPFIDLQKLLLPAIEAVSP